MKKKISKERWLTFQFNAIMEIESVLLLIIDKVRMRRGAIMRKIAKHRNIPLSK